MNKLIEIVLIFTAVLIALSCGSNDSAKASGPYTAMEIGSLNGVRCFVILDGNSNAVGGNCQ